MNSIIENNQDLTVAVKNGDKAWSSLSSLIFFIR